MAVNTMISNNAMVNRLIKNSFLKDSIAFQLVVIHIGVNRIVKVIRNRDKPSIANRASPQFKILNDSSQLHLVNN